MTVGVQKVGHDDVCRELTGGVKVKVWFVEGRGMISASLQLVLLFV